MTNKIIQKIIAGIIVNLLILQTLPVVRAEDLVTPVSETPTTVSEPVITEPITDATVEPEPDQSIPGDEVAPTETEPDPAPAPEPEAPIEDIPQYNQLMRQVDKTVDFTTTENSFYKAILQNLPQKLKDEKYQTSKESIGTELEIFIDAEKEKLADSDIDETKKEAYFNQLEKQLDIIEGDIPPEAKPPEEVKIAPEPSSFTLDQKEIEIEDVEDIFIEKTVDPGLMEDTLKKLKLIQVAEAYVDSYMPVLEDLQDDGAEVIINQEIRDLARELEGNPVKIFNFVRNNIDYEPYYGAKKNSAGCLRERICNDVDTASLTIALMRASGIPARYKKSLAIVDVGMLKELLGVEQTQTIFKAVQSPLFTVDGEHDFDAMTKLAVQWVHPEIFYPYDERSGNFSATAHPEFADINEMRAFLREFNDNQWIPVDAAMKSYTHTANEIVSDTEDFDTENFWQEYLEYQGELSPIEKYEEELGLNPEDEQTRSGKTLVQEEFDFLPYTLPYLVAQGNAEGNEIAIENFSALPDVYKNHVTISLLNEADGQTVFSHTFTASEVNNQPIDLYYQGFTDLDETTIVEHGGVHATPAALVDIKPLLVLDGEQYEGDQPLQIGQSLLLQFEYPEFDKVDQKFSVAGNQEGIYLYFSKLQDDQFFDDESDPDRNSKILLEGNAMMAREYLRKVENNTTQIGKYLDYDFDVAVNRAVVTQKRILNELDEIATTFDFKGLSIDASLYGNGYSNRGPLETHSDDFSLLWLLYASYYESQLFTDLTGLNAISTVTGLQYAYGNPDQYEVLTITPQNSGAVDDLDLSDNTKANMRADLASGATIITPNKPIQKENWRGIVYISRLPDGVDNYAIGEQAEGNGGETVTIVVYSGYEKEIEIREADGTRRKQMEEADYAKSITPRGVVIYDEEAGLTCVVPPSEYDKWLNDESWPEKWGYPCYQPGEFNPGPNGKRSDTAQNFLDYYGFLPTLTGNGVIFYSEDYAAPDNYWRSESQLRNGFKDYITEKKNLNPNHLNWLSDGENLTQTKEKAEDRYRFSPVLGSPLWNICERSKANGDCEEFANVYYVPDDQNEAYFRARGDVLNKLADGNNLVIERLGLPIAEEVTADNSNHFVGAFSQRFSKGVVYKIPFTYFIDRTIYVKRYTYDLIDKKHRELGGTPGELGFPTGDLIDEYAASLGKIYQFFENDKVLVWNMNTDTVAVSSPDNPAGVEPADCDVYNGDYNDAQLSGFFLWGLVDSGVDELSGIGSFGYNTLAFLLGGDYGEKWEYVKDLIEELNGITTDQAKQMLGDSVGQYFDDLDADLSNNDDISCSAKRSYTRGKLLGFATINIGLTGSGINLLIKVRLLKQFGPLLESGKASKFSKPLLEFITKKGLFKYQKIDNASTINKMHTDYWKSINPNGKEIKPYKTTIPVTTIKILNAIDHEFVRAFADNGSGHIGVWIMRKSDVIDPNTGAFLRISEIRDKFAIPNPPTHLEYLDLPAGTELRFGIAKSQILEDGTILKGNGEQFEIVTNSMSEKPPAELFDYEHKILLLP